MKNTLIENRLKEIGLSKVDFMERLSFMGITESELNEYLGTEGPTGSYVESIIFNILSINEFNDFYPLSHVRNLLDSNQLTEIENYMIDLAFLQSI